MNRTVVLLSGGLDSTVLAAALAKRHEVHALTIHYGQRHAIELLAAKRVAEALAIPHRQVDLRDFGKLLPNSSQTDVTVAVPHGHYEEESMRTTVVPNRNMVMLAVAAGHALAIGARSVAIAAHAGDHAVYPDCREEFFTAFVRAVRQGNWDAEGFTVDRPFVGASKADIVTLGVAEGAPLALSYSCYEGKSKHCGKCGTCVERREAFSLAGVVDPTEYEP
jgi:7-cyano-7-deazaguanine synthase